MAKPGVKERFVNLYNQIRDYYTGATCGLKHDIIELYFEREHVRLMFYRSGPRVEVLESGYRNKVLGTIDEVLNGTLQEYVRKKRAKAAEELAYRRECDRLTDYTRWEEVGALVNVIRAYPHYQGAEGWTFTLNHLTGPEMDAIHQVLEKEWRERRQALKKELDELREQILAISEEFTVAELQDQVKAPLRPSDVVGIVRELEREKLVETTLKGFGSGRFSVGRVTEAAKLG